MAPRLKAANLAKTTLASPCSAASTTIKVSSSAAFPEPPFRIFMGSEGVAYEIMEVTAVDGNTWTVIRGLEGTQARAWEAGTSVENRFTAGTFSELAKSPHADEHRPGGTDPLATGTPVSITPGASASEGTAQAFARTDHVHATPSQWPPTAHAASHESGGEDALNPENIGANWNRLVNKPSAFPPEAHAASHENGGADAINPNNIGANWNLLVNKPSSFPPESHASSHQPGGSDALPTGIPSQITVGATSSEGTSQAFARADHVHATPNTWPPSSHASSHEEGGSDALNPANLGANWNKIVNKPEVYPPEHHAASHEAGGSDALDPSNIGANWNLLVNKPSIFPPEAHAASHENGGADAINPSNIGANWNLLVNKPSNFPPESHASSHQPGGSDALPTGIPSQITVGATSSEGTSQAFARADHVHATPNTWPPSSHASSHEEGGSDALNPANLGANWNKIVNKPEVYPPEHHAASHEAGGSDALDPSNIGANWNLLVNKPSIFPPEAHSSSHVPGGTDALPTGTPSGITPGSTSSEGTASSFARSDHVHATPETWPPSAHASSHESGGADELNVSGLQGVLADFQKAKIGVIANKVDFPSPGIPGRLAWAEDEQALYQDTGTAWTKVSPYTFLELSDTPGTYSGQGGKVVRVKTSEDGLEFVSVAGGAARFLELEDTPSSYSGQALKYVRVNSDETGLEFASAVGGAGNFLELSDTPNSYSGASGYLVRVKTTTDGLEFINPASLPVASHASSHEEGGTDAINPANIGANWNKLVNKPAAFPPESHATAHQPGGIDALPTGTPAEITIGATGSEGTSTLFARADHVHATPSTWPPSTHGNEAHEPDFADMETVSRTIYVDADNGSDTTGDGTADKPFRTLAYALSTVKNVIADGVTVTIRLKAATSAYSVGSFGRFTIGTGSLVIEGELITLASGTVQSVTAGVADPTYGSSVLVDKIYCGSRGWSTNQYQWKLVRFTKSGTEKLAVIWANDADNLYIAQGMGIDNTWAWEIVDWGTILTSGFTIRQGSMTLSKLKLKGDGMLSIQSLDSVTISGCLREPESSSAAVYGFSVGPAKNVSFLDCVMNGLSSTRRAIHVAGSVMSMIVARSAVISWSSGIWGESVGEWIGRLQTCRFKNCSSYGLDLSNVSVNCWSNWGKNVIDGSSTGVRLGPLSFLEAASSYVHFVNCSTNWSVDSLAKYT